MTGDFIKTTPYSYLVGVVILLASHGYVYFTGREHGLEKYYALHANLESERQQTAIASERLTRDVSQSWADALDFARRNPRIVRVRDNGCGLQIPKPAGQLDAAPIEPGFSTTVDVAECEARLTNAVIDASQLAHLQYWIKLQNEVTE